MTNVNIISANQIAELASNLRAYGKTIVATNGCFDILHIGHLRYLEKSKSFADVLVVGINSDASVRHLKGEGRPINSEQDRAELLLGLKPVDYVVIFDERDASSFLRELKPDVYTKGGDYKPEALPEYSTVQEIKAKIEIVDLVEGKSSSKIIEQIHS